jgi:ankyrin repeat protein
MSDAIPLPPRPHLDHYRKLAKELLRAAEPHGTAGEDAVRVWALRWMESSARLRDEALMRNAPTTNAAITGSVELLAHDAGRVAGRWLALRQKMGAARPSLTDAQFFLAREHGFLSWPKFAEHVRALENAQSPVANFEAAADAIVTGNIDALDSLLRSDPALVKARSTREHRSTLLHYCSANGVEDYRQKTPANLVAIARMLLDVGAEVNAESDAYGDGSVNAGSTTLLLTATSVHPERAGLQIPLLELLLEYGAAIDRAKDKPDGHSAVVACLHNGRGRAAEFLASRGARLDLEGAAGVGDLDAVRGFFTEDGNLRPPATAQQRAPGFGWACEFGRTNVVEFLLGHDVEASAPLSGDGETGLHWAALEGNGEIVRLLLARGADVNATETRFGGTPLGWALHGYHDGPEPRAERFYDVVTMLVRAGAVTNAFAKASAMGDTRMQAALDGADRTLLS